MEQDIRLTRVHKILAARSHQLNLNISAVKGGNLYIKQRLTRFPCESDVSWCGDKTIGIVGRKDRAFLIPYASRISTKLNQYLFSTPPTREGVDPDFSANVTKTGVSINAFWEQVSEMYTASQWGWICVDRGAPALNPATGELVPRTTADKEQQGDRVFWTAYPPSAVVDWRYDAAGNLKWLITEETVYENDDINVAARDERVRTIWRPGEGERLWLKADGTLRLAEPFKISANVVPFVRFGFPSVDPWWFDDVERIMSGLMNLESAHYENLIKAVYPQLVIPEGIVDRIMELTKTKKTRTDYKRAVEMLRGLDYPIVEPDESKGITRYLQPTATDLSPIPDSIKRMRTELYEVVGMALNNRESRQVASAEAKEWDHLDLSATLGQRAGTLEDTERKCISISRLIDTSFPDYKVSYSRDFSVSDPETDFKALIEVDNFSDLPPEARREVVRAVVKKLNRMVRIDPARLEEINKAIDAMDMTGMPAFMTPPPPPAIPPAPPVA